MNPDSINIEEITKTLCETMCADVEVVRRGEGLLFVSTPFTFSDGDLYSIYLKMLPAGGFRITDMGGTLMHLSYESEIDKLRDGTRGKVFNEVLAERGGSTGLDRKSAFVKC
jgi:Domain of unknown function DUF1828